MMAQLVYQGIANSVWTDEIKTAHTKLEADELKNLVKNNHGN